MKREDDIDLWEYRRILALLHRAYMRYVVNRLNNKSTKNLQKFIATLELEAMQYEYPFATVYAQLQKEQKIKQSLIELQISLIQHKQQPSGKFIQSVDNIINIIDNERTYNCY